MIDLQNKVALITGGSKGIGRSIVQAFAKSGAIVCFVARNPETARKLVDEIRLTGAVCDFYQADVGDADQCESVVREVIKQHGKIDILVNNAGITDDNLIVRMKKESWDRVLNVNLSSLFNMSKAVMRPMMKNKYGRIINMSSVVAITGNPGQVNYASAKAGIIGFTKSLAKEVASRNITVNAIAPGYIQSDMTDNLTEQQQQAMLNTIPMHRMGKPEDIANSALFLASSLADYITGTTLHVNGGMI
ncbi:3-oxoacyl-ACP reductase FabG [bacterium]|nr:3-oxoacyl-ACP reductase FabG [bacterium]